MSDRGVSQETRTFHVVDLEVREEGVAQPEIVGYAAVFNERSRNLGGFIEEIEPGAFRATLSRKPDVRANVQHENGLATIGRTKNGTLELLEDDKGLRVRILPPDTQAGRDALALVRGGYMDQMSFAFNVPQGGDAWTRMTDGTPLRRLLEIELDGGDVALVTNPAYPQTSAEARAMAAELSSANENGEAESMPGGAQGGESGAEDGGERSQGRLSRRRFRLELAKRKLAGS